MVGKLIGRVAGAVTAQPGRPGRLGLLVDEATKDRFLVDTGAVYSVIPFSSTAPPTGPAISSASGVPIPCWGWCRRTLRTGGRVFEWCFLKAAVAFPLVGADFLDWFDLMVDLRRLQLVPAKGAVIALQAPPVGSVFATIGVRPSTPSPLQQRLSTNGSSTAALQHRLNSSSSTTAMVQRGATPDEYTQLLQKFPAVLNPSKKLPPVKHSVLHFIETDGRPVTSRYRRLDSEKLVAAKAEFQDLERQGIVRRSSSSWASPLHMVRKEDGSWRPCGDFRRLNLQTRPDLYTCPNIGDLTARLAGCKVFSKLDLRKGYHQVPVKKEDIPKTAIITPFGLFEFIRMPFGLRNAGQTFQRMMDSVLAELSFCFCYLDDVLVASPDHSSHQQHLNTVLQRLQQHGLVLNAEKCQLGVSELDYLGHHVSATGIRPIVSRVEVIEKFPKPRTVRQMQTFLGMINFYRRFLPGAARVLKPLTDSLQGSPKGEVTWTEEMEKAFAASKASICKCVELAHPEATAQLALAVDASETHCGAVLQQHMVGGWRPLSFFSVKLDSTQRKYSAFDRELLAVYLAVRHFRWLLEGRNFVVLSDHKPLWGALHRMTDAWSARQQRQLSYIAEFTSDIQHIAGTDNVVADALSRPAAGLLTAGGVLSGEESSSNSHLRFEQDQPPAVARRGSSNSHLRLEQDQPLAAASTTTAAVSMPTDKCVKFNEIAAEQAVCAETKQLRERMKQSVQQVVVQGQEMWCDTSTGALRPLVPVSQRRLVFEAVHNLAHPGIRATKRMVASRFIWEGCAKDVTAWCRECQGCNTGKVTVQETTDVHPIPLPAERFQHVHVDLVGPLPTSAEGYTHLLTVVDRTTRWPEVLPLHSTSAEAVADSFLHGWVARFGVPKEITTDRGTQFTSAVWKSVCKQLGAEHILTTAYHPQSNGMVERFHRQLKEALRARGCGAAWMNHLPWVLLGLRAAPKEDSAISAAEAVYGEQLNLPGQVQHHEEDRGIRPAATPLRERNYTVNTRPSILEEAEFVYVRRGAVGGPFTDKYSGPYKVMEKKKKYYKLQLGQRTDWVSADRLKPHLGRDPRAAAPPRRGRPPGTSGHGGSPGPGGPELVGGPVAARKEE